jgi:hypothetical protein
MRARLDLLDPGGGESSLCEGGRVDDIDLAQKLALRLARRRVTLEKWDRYYKGEQPLAYMHPDLQRELAPRISQVVINWPQLVVDSVEERLDVEGFALGGDDALASRLWGWWQANNLDVTSQEAHTDALAMGVSYVIVGSQDGSDVPLVTVESPLQVVARLDPATRQVNAAIKTWVDSDEDMSYLTLYLPDRTVRFAAEGAYDDLSDDLPTKNPRLPTSARWSVMDQDDHMLGRVMVTPLVNRARTLDRNGVPEFAPILPLSDAACKIATDMMVSADFNAIPRTIAYGSTEDDWIDQDGRKVSKWEKIAGRIWAIAGTKAEAEVSQLPAADLRNFHETINSLAKLAGSMAGLPPTYMGWTDANPASAEGIQATVMRLVKRCERRIRGFGGSWEDVARNMLIVADGELPENAERLESVWRDPSTPTLASEADALVKLAAGLGIPGSALWEKIPGVTKSEADAWRAAAAAERVQVARAQATAFGIDGLENGDS